MRAGFAMALTVKTGWAVVGITKRLVDDLRNKSFSLRFFSPALNKFLESIKKNINR